jgi:hypothetical protein
LHIGASKSDGQIQENTVPHWLLPCTCNNQTQRCQCNAKLRPDILCIRNHPYNTKPPTQPNPTLIVQFIEFTYCNDRYSLDKINEKIVKYEGLVEDIKARGWKVDPLLVLIIGSRSSTNKNAISALKNLYTIPKTLIEPMVSQLNTNAIKYAMNILVIIPTTKTQKNHCNLFLYPSLISPFFFSSLPILPPSIESTEGH